MKKTADYWKVKNTKKHVKMLQTAYWLKWPKCKYPKNCGPDVSILVGPLSKAEWQGQSKQCKEICKNDANCLLTKMKKMYEPDVSILAGPVYLW